MLDRKKNNLSKKLDTIEVEKSAVIFELIEAMKKVDINSPESEANKYSITDINGDRIYF